jgi:hypothetical protein
MISMFKENGGKWSLSRVSFAFVIVNCIIMGYIAILTKRFESLGIIASLLTGAGIVKGANSFAENNRPKGETHVDRSSESLF